MNLDKSSFLLFFLFLSSVLLSLVSLFSFFSHTPDKKGNSKIIEWKQTKIKRRGVDHTLTNKDLHADGDGYAL